MTQGAQPSALGQPRGVEWGAAREAGSEGEVAQSYLTLHDPMDYSLPVSSVNVV